MVHGSFTGVRIGVSTIKAFADVKNIPSIGISSLEGLAYNSLQSNYLKKGHIVCSIIDAKNDNIYYAFYKEQDSSFILIEEPNFTNINEFTSILKKYSNDDILFIGDGAITHKYNILKCLSKTTFIEKKLNDQTSSSIGISAFYNHKNNNTAYLNNLSPLYLRKSQAERALEGEK